MQESISIP